MSESTTPPRAIKDFKRAMEAIGSLTVGDITDFLTGKGAKPHCSSCERNDWSIFNSGTEGIGTLDLQLPKDILANSVTVGGPMVPLVLMQCKNCGYMRQHSALAIARWKLGEDFK